MNQFEERYQELNALLTRFNLKKGNYDKMRESVGIKDWSGIEEGSVDEIWNEIKVTIKEAMEKYIPKVSYKQNTQVEQQRLSKKALRKLKKTTNCSKDILNQKVEKFIKDILN